MRLQILSDVHLEFAGFVPPEVDADVTILAGDIGVGWGGLEWIQQHWRTRPIVYVLGNHEYYKHTMQKLLRELKGGTEGTNVHVLENDAITLGDVTFVGATLWSDLALYQDPVISAIAVQVGMADYSQIRTEPHSTRLKPAETRQAHAESRSWLQDQCAKRQGERIVVVTHHSPSARSVHRDWVGDPLTPAFASNLDDLVEASSALLWVHGHIHQGADYTIGKTRVVSNPRGYPGEETAFEPALVIEV